jgi:hypothetical protein
MNQILSSRWTFIFKYVFPGIWIPGFGLAVADSFLHPETVIYNDVRGAAPPYIGWDFLAVWLIASICILWLCAPLKGVRVENEVLLVSNYWHEWRIPFGAVAKVTQNRWINIRPITVHLRADVGCGTRVVFMPPSRWRVLFWREDPEVDDLRRLAGIADPQPAADV